MSDTLARITKLAKVMIEQEAEVKRLKAALADAEGVFWTTRTEDLPELMREVGLSQIQLDTGEKIEVREDVKCKIPEGRRDEAIRWLVDNGFGGLIKTVVAVEFDRGSIDTAEQLAQQLVEDGLAAITKADVHPNTLTSFVREQLAAGRSVPFELFGVFPFNIATYRK